MTDVVWTHSSEGFNLRISTRESELTLASNMPVASMDVRFDRGLNPVVPPPQQAPDTPAVVANPPVVFYVYAPVLITIVVHFEDEGIARYIYNVDSEGNISVARNMAGAGVARFVNVAKGLGKGRPPV